MNMKIKTIAEMLNVKEFPFTTYDSNGNKIYYEDSEGFWVKFVYDSNGNEIYYYDSTGYWIKTKYDSKGNKILTENSEGVKIKGETATIKFK